MIDFKAGKQKCHLPLARHLWGRTLRLGVDQFGNWSRILEMNIIKLTFSKLCGCLSGMWK